MANSRILRILAALGALAVLAACANPGTAKNAPGCPNIIIVKDTAELTAFKPGPGRDLTDVVLEGRLDRFDGFCETNLERDKSGEVDVDLRLFFELARGPASTARETVFDYYVAIADRKGNILAKETFQTSVAFAGNRTRLDAVEEVTPTIPLAAGQTGEDFDIFVGFQLAGEQLDYNRGQHRR